VRRREAYADYSRRLRALAREPLGARLVLVGGARSLPDYLEAQRVLRWITAHDGKLHAAFVEESRRVEVAQKTLGEREARLAKSAEAARAERDRLAAARGERLALLERMVTDKATAVRAAEERRLAHSGIASMLRRLVPAGALSESFAKNRGRLPWPTAGAVGQPFGDTVDKRFGTVVAHPGLDLVAKSGTPVQAVAPGIVAFAGWLRGFGQTVILDHGGDYHTLSAHLAGLRVAEGDAVAAGAVIGTVGDTGSVAGTLLYFELRKAGVPEDPLPWLRR
jgi:septal ring factor EnvC (AmiA/AmiB activator)